jgi:hypothetical protein
MWWVNFNHTSDINDCVVSDGMSDKRVILMAMVNIVAPVLYLSKCYLGSFKLGGTNTSIWKIIKDDNIDMNE